MGSHAIPNQPGWTCDRLANIYNPYGDREVRIMNKSGYPVIDMGDRYRSVHRLIAQTFVDNPAPYFFGIVDHINRDKGDARPCNLRWVNQAINMLNREAVNVYWSSRKGKWEAKFRSEGRNIHMGYFTDKLEALRRVKEARKQQIQLLITKYKNEQAKRNRFSIRER